WKVSVHRRPDQVDPYVAGSYRRERPTSTGSRTWSRLRFRIGVRASGSVVSGSIPVSVVVFRVR
ncbi:MAG: hypothetical protein Q4C47_00325, partial [Planctomycetia bacterium]|nr:hypothetical protein [Planctomycetia bacterium]